MHLVQHFRLRPLLAAAALAIVFSGAVHAGDKPLTFADLMRFRTLHHPSIARDGSWIAYDLQPDRGDGEAVARSTSLPVEHRIERGADPRTSGDGLWVVATIEPSFAERVKAEKKKDGGNKDDKDKPKKGMALLHLMAGTELRFEKVESFALSDDGRWLAYKLHREEEEEKDEEEKPEEEKSEEKAEEEKKAKDKEEKRKKELGSTLMLRDLREGQEIALVHVKSYAFDEPSALLAYAVEAPEGAGDGVFLRALRSEGTPQQALFQQDGTRSTHLTWLKSGKEEEQSLLAFVTAPLDEEGEAGDATVWAWEGAGDARRVASRDEAPAGWTVPSVNELKWSRDGQRLFFGFKPVDPEGEDDDEDGEEELDPHDFEAILEDRGVDVWHWNDPLINSNQKKRWEEREKDRTYRAVFHRATGRVVALADLEVREVEVPENPRVALARADVPYLKEVTWSGRYADLYVVDLGSGERQEIATRLSEEQTASLSPGGRYVIYYDEGHFHVYDVERRTARNVTAALGVPFADEDHDYPSPPPDYGMAEWLADEGAVLVYDKFDVWRVPTGGGAPTRITGGFGRERGYKLRVVDLDPEVDALERGAPLLLEAEHDRLKHESFYAAREDREGVEPLYETGEHRLGFVARAEDADRLLFTHENYNEFPDLWTADLEISPLDPPKGTLQLSEPVKQSDANPQIDEFAWGTAELVEWRSLDGVPLQGALIKPGNYEPGKRYPVLVYYYRFSSHRVYEFNEPVINHRPSFPIYASNGYAIFLPDIRFEVGRPGFSATKCLVPGVQKLIDMGIADGDAVGLHGHSWSGYQTAFVITQTDVFAAAVAGAPVSNMTSAYSGIRWETGLARQFQYEMSQSRIGGSLWEYPERYVENSPVFYAHHIDTPLLIEFGDEDEAVPWYQGIELYLAMRRLGKEAIFLQYRGEPHHLKKYANKLDYSIKMKEFFDHHLKGAPAPAWMTEGVPYRGE
jgi:dipeptidyl aminopeptidase/acylaminoacyl peptidase